VVLPDPSAGASRSVADSLREAVFDVGGAAQLVLDAAGTVVMANGSARGMFAVGVADLGRPIQDLELSYRPVELRGHLETVADELRTVDLKGIRWRTGGVERVLDIRIAPLMSDGTRMGAVISYADVTDVQRLHDELSSSRRDLETASEELQSTVEELETTNEELQSTNEELETTNEELQSTNEELETMNEELHSANEELQTMNEELRHRTLELNDTNTFLEVILATIGVAVAVLDRHQRVKIWNGQAYELWGLTAEEVEDHNLLALDFGLPVEKLKPLLRETLNGGDGRAELMIEAVNRRGKTFDCRVTALPTGNDGEDRLSGVILMMEEVSA
jgi:two-component system CheB/CheR fusion protein